MLGGDGEGGGHGAVSGGEDGDVGEEEGVDWRRGEDAGPAGLDGFEGSFRGHINGLRGFGLCV